MAWTTLGEALEAALVSMMNDAGLDGVGAPSDAVKLAKSADPEGPASFRVEQRQMEEMPDGTSRERMNAALPMGRKQRIAPGRPIPVVASPKPAVRCFLVIEGGGRPTGGNSRAAFRAAAGRERAREFRVIEGGHHWTDTPSARRSV